MVLAFNFFFREKGGQKIQCSIIRKMVQCVHNHLQDYVNSMYFLKGSLPEMLVLLLFTNQKQRKFVNIIYSGISQNFLNEINTGL